MSDQQPKYRSRNQTLNMIERRLAEAANLLSEAAELAYQAKVGGKQADRIDVARTTVDLVPAYQKQVPR